jgi:hypothetical protein
MVRQSDFSEMVCSGARGKVDGRVEDGDSLSREQPGSISSELACYTSS